MKTLTLLSIAAFACIQLNAQTPDSSQFYFKKGTDEASAKRYLIAGKYFDMAINFNSKFTEAYIENGKANLEMRKVDAALVNFTKANQLQPSNPVAIKELSLLYFNNRQFAKAIDMAQQCKDCAASDRIIAMSYYQTEDYGKAVPGLQKALAKNPADAEVSYTLARTYLELEEEKNAIPYYQKAVQLDSTKNVWMYELALMYYNMDQYADAVKYFAKASNAGYPKSNDFYENCGFAYLYSRDIENGMTNLSIVLSRKPNNSTLLTDIAQAMYQAKRYDDALVYYQKLIELNAKDSKALYMAGITFQKKGEKEKGQALCDQAIAMDPSLAEKRQKKGEQFGL
ncbi:MAG: tetratricopeptide repeat protein [Ginsengibacter sp.]